MCGVSVGWLLLSFGGSIKKNTATFHHFDRMTLLGARANEVKASEFLYSTTRNVRS